MCRKFKLLSIDGFFFAENRVFVREIHGKFAEYSRYFRGLILETPVYMIRLDFPYPGQFLINLQHCSSIFLWKHMSARIKRGTNICFHNLITCMQNMWIDWCHAFFDEVMVPTHTGPIFCWNSSRDISRKLAAIQRRCQSTDSSPSTWE